MNSLEPSFLKDLNANIGIVYQICKVYCGTDDLEREDLFQEIMYQLWRSYSSFASEAKFSTWMYKVSLNTAITHLRKRKRTPDQVSITDSVNEYPEIKDSNRSADLYAAIQTLSVVDKAIILLHLDENTYDEIGEIMGITRSNVSVRLVRIKKRLEEKLKTL